MFGVILLFAITTRCNGQYGQPFSWRTSNQLPVSWQSSNRLPSYWSSNNQFQVLPIYQRQSQGSQYGNRQPPIWQYSNRQPPVRHYDSWQPAKPSLQDYSDRIVFPDDPRLSISGVENRPHVTGYERNPISWSQQLAAINNQFSWRFLSNVYEEKNNIFFSPLSITTVLGMLLLGAKGETKREIESVMNLSNGNWSSRAFAEATSYYKNAGQNRDFDFSLANLLYISNQHTINSQYMSDLKGAFKAQIENVNFKNDGEAIKSRINEFVKQSTKNEIESILKETPNANTVALLLNAIYFKGKWKQPFNKRSTYDMEFIDSSNRTLKVKTMMAEKEALYGEFQSRNVKILQLPYFGNISMFIILPTNKVPLKTIISKNFNFENEMKNLKEKEVEIFLPKFKLETETDLIPSLTRMNVRSLFQRNADLSGISNNIYVSKANHKAVIEVDEEGSKAAAVTTFDVQPLSIAFNPSFRCNQPFLFIIKDVEKDINMFMGLVNTIN